VDFGAKKPRTTMDMDIDPLSSGEELELIAREIEVGIQFAGQAAAEYASGDRIRARGLRASAQKAHDEVLQRLRQSEARGRDVSTGRERLQDLADRLAGLAEEDL
jgi:hypothetical protein